METTPELAAEGSALVQVLAAVLDRLVCANTSLALADPGHVTKFHALKAPGIGVRQYLERIHKYASCSNECFVLALIYIDRLIQRNNFLLTELNVHRVVITAILLAAKFFDDAYYNNAYYAKVGGVLISEMNGLEVDFLFRINFSLHVTPELFQKYRAELVSHAVGAGVNLPAAPATHMGRPTHTEAHAHMHAPHVAVSSGPFPTQAHAFSSAKQPSYITPSPPGHSKPVVYPTDSTGTASTSSSTYYPSSSIPVANQGVSTGTTSSANATHHRAHYHHHSSGTVPPVGASLDRKGDQFVVIENVTYPVQGGMIHVNHGAQVEAQQVALGGLYHPTASYMGGKSEATTAVTVTPHFVG